MATATSSLKPEKLLQPSSGRLTFLDVCRGLAVAGMILVDNPGSDDRAFGWIKHAEWNGWTPPDFIFPTFVFVVGISMVFSFSARLQRGESRQRIFLHALKRSAILFAIGLWVNGFPLFDLATMRWEGVTQRIAVCYLLAAILVLWSDRRGQIAAIIACLVGYWAIMRFVPVPGFGVPGRDIPFLDPYKNIGAWLDRKLFMGHLYNETRDPEGIVSTIPAIATTLLGVLAGEWLKTSHTHQKKAVRMLVFGVAGLVAGLVLDKAWFPINKNVWSSSFVIFAAGFTLILLSALYWIVEIRGWKRWTMPALVFGTNAIAGFVADSVVYGPMYSLKAHGADGKLVLWQQYAYAHLYPLIPSAPIASLVYSIAAVLFCWTLVWLLYRKQIFIKV